MHNIGSSFDAQITRLNSAGFPREIMRRSAQKVLKAVNSSAGCEAGRLVERNRIAVIPYMHRISHGLKNVAGRYGVRVVFSAPNKLGRICKMVEKKLSRQKAGTGCSVKHVSPFVPCSTGIVYSLPFSCGDVYIGQSGRCVNVRLMEHRASLRNNPFAHVTRHCKAHEESSQEKCNPVYKDTSILWRHNDNLTRELVEAFHIRKSEGKCISQASVTLYDKEFAFMSKNMP